MGLFVLSKVMKTERKLAVSQLFSMVYTCVKFTLQLYVLPGIRLSAATYFHDKNTISTVTIPDLHSCTRFLLCKKASKQSFLFITF